MLGEIGHRIAVINQNIQIRQGAQQSPPEQGPAAQRAGENGAPDGGTQYGL